MRTYKNNLFLLLLVGIISLVSGHLDAENYSIIDDCLIRADIEPDQEAHAYRAVNVSQTALELPDWSNLEAANQTDSDVAVVSLEGNQSSQFIEFSSFYADIQPGSKIHGVQLKISGSSTHYGLIEESSIQFYFDGQAIGSNLAGKSNIANPWKEANSSWEYGYEFSDWDVDWTAELLASKELSVRIQVKNIDEEEFIEAYIDNVEIIVHYTELYTLCSHACVVLYNDLVDNALKYIWDVPEGVKFLNNDPEHNVVNLDFSEAEDGILDIDLTIVRATDTLYCTRQVFHTICEDASIGDLVWFDENFDGLQDENEQGIANVNITLFNPYSEEIQSTNTGSDGSFSFQDVPKGFYFMKANTNGFVASPFQVGDDELDSDLREDLTTSVFYLFGGDSIVSFDFGLFDEGSIAGKVWEECDGNGNFNDVDILLEAKSIELYLNNIHFLSTETNDQGEYEFTGLFPGNYTVVIDSEDPGSTMNSNTNPDVENDFVNNELSFILEPGQDLEGLDAAINPKVKLSFNIFFDENADGEMDDAEMIFEGFIVELRQNNQFVKSVEIAEGFAHFTDLEMLDYELHTSIPNDYSVLSQEGFETNVFSGFYHLTDFDVDCREDFTYNLLLGPQSSSIGDFIWFDENRNGVQDLDEKGIENVNVYLVNDIGDQIAQTISDENGFYIFDGLTADTYGLLIDYPEENRELTFYSPDNDYGSQGQLVNDQVVAGPIELVLGVDQMNWDIGFRDKYGIVSDRAWVDDNGNGLQDDGEKGLPKVLVKIYNTSDELVAEKETNNDGYYSISVPAGEYYASFNHDEYIEYTVYDLTFDLNLNSDVIPMTGRTDIFTVIGNETRDDIDAGFLPRTAIIGDLVFLDLNANGKQDPDEVGLNNFMVEVYTENGTLINSTVTDEAGYYQMEVEEGEYYLKFSKDGFDEVSPSIPADPENDSNITGQYGFGTTDLIAFYAFDQRNDIDAGFLTIPTTIGDYVWLDYNTNGIQDDNEIGQGGITVNLVKLGGGVVGSTVSGDGFDNDKGFYSFVVDQPGDYYLQFVLPDATWTFSDSDVFDDDKDSDVSFDNGYGTTPTFYLEIGEDRTDIDAGVIGISAIVGDYVWLDKNNNGLQDADENGVNGLNVFLYDEFFNFIDVTITTFNQQSGHDGYYEFPEIEAGQYVLVFDTADPFSAPNVGTNPDIDSDVTSQFVNGSTGIITVDGDSQVFNVDAGISNSDLGQTGQVGDLVWEDLNKNGIYELDEKGKEGVYIELINQNGEVIASTESDSEGFYNFGNVPVGEYRIFVEMPDDFTSTIIDNSYDDETDSDVKEDGYTDFFNIAGGLIIDNIDFGLVPTNGLVEGTVWLDSDLNGMMDINELVMEDIIVKLYDESSNLIQETVTNSMGKYQFKNLLVSSYYVEYEATEEYEFISTNNDDDDNMITNNYGFGTTDIFNLLMYDAYYISANAGLFVNVALAEQSIELESYKDENYSNVLLWTPTIVELTDHFIIERKVLNETWEEIGTVLANEELEYNYIDYDAKFIKEHVAYRIQQINIANISIQSPEKLVLYHTQQNLNVYPNPTKDQSILMFEIEEKQSIELGLYNLEGKLIRKYLNKKELDAGEYEKSLNLRGLSVGTYVLKYVSGEETRIQKVIIQ